MATGSYTLLVWVIAIILAVILVGGIVFFFKYRRKQGDERKPDGQLRH